MSPSLREHFRDVVARALGVPPEAIEAEAALDELAPLDSLSLAELGSALDRGLGIVVAGEELRTSMTIGELEVLVEEAVQAMDRAG